MQVASPPSPDRSQRNPESSEANSFYDQGSPSSKFSSGNYWNNAPGVIGEAEGASTDAKSAGFIDEGVPVEDAFKADVIACVKFMRTQDGKDWHVSNVNEATRSDDGSASLNLVLCSGDLCLMKKFTVQKGVVSVAASGGLFG